MINEGGGSQVDIGSARIDQEFTFVVKQAANNQHQTCLYVKVGGCYSRMSQKNENTGIDDGGDGMM